jgi:hypothetical protein
MSEQQTAPGEGSPTADPNDDTGQSLPPQPPPKSEPPAPPPGGPHAVPGVGGEGAYSAQGRDPNPDHNPATDTELPDEAKEPEDTDTEATQGRPEVKPTEESPA